MTVENKTRYKIIQGQSSGHNHLISLSGVRLKIGKKYNFKNEAYKIFELEVDS